MLSNWRSPPRPVAKSTEQGSRITGDPGKSVEGERDSAGSVLARKRSNVRGAKRPCCLCLGKPVQAIDGDGVVIGDQRIPAKTVVWTAGVAPSPAGKWLGCAVDRAGRVRIQPDLTVPGHPDVFVVGDTASLDQDGRPLPGVAQVAMQQGKYAARSIFRKVIGRPPLPPFRYFDKGNLAVVGRGFAVLQSAGVQLSGFMAWLVWALIHIQFLAETSLRFSVFLQWVWTYLSGKRGARLIIRQRTGS